MIHVRVVVVKNIRGVMGKNKKASVYAEKGNIYFNERFSISFHFLGFTEIQLGLHVSFKAKNIEIHLPFSYVRIGKQNAAKLLEFSSIKSVRDEYEKVESEAIEQEIKEWEREQKRKHQYNELIMAVETKYSGEIRHKTALRYIKEAEMSKLGTEKEDNKSKK